MARETGVQSQVESYQRLKKWYLMLPCITLSNIRYRSRVKWSNPGKGVAPSPTPWCSSYGHQLHFYLLLPCTKLYIKCLESEFLSILSQLLADISFVVINNIKRFQEHLPSHNDSNNLTQIQPSRLRPQNTPAASLLRGKTRPMHGLYMTLNNLFLRP